MTITHSPRRDDQRANVVDPRPPAAAPTDTELTEIFQPVFDRIARDVLDRELNRVLPFEPVAWLREVRFGALRVPREFGGYGVSWGQFLSLLVDLAAADPNVAHLFRGHIAVVEEKLASPRTQTRELWLRRFGRGDIVGNASTEPGNTPLLKKQTLLTEENGGLVLNGTKFYSTGSIFADWIDASATDDSGEQVNILLSARQPGVELSDDWDGFGQRLTGTGTTVFTNAVVEPHAVQKRPARLSCLDAVYQIVLLAATAGIARTLAQETGDVVRSRSRIYSHGNSSLVRDDPQILQIVGEIDSVAYAARSLVLSTVPAFEAALEEFEASHTAGIPSEDARLEATYKVQLDVYRTQVVLADIVLKAATHLFDALSSSAIRTSSALDRHWRNARTILSHNPVIYRARVLGDYAINHRNPALAAAVGVAPQAAEKEPTK